MTVRFHPLGAVLVLLLAGPAVLATSQEPASSPAARRQQELPFAQADLRIDRGRGSVADRSNVVALVAGRRSVSVREPAHVELGIRSRATVRWVGRGSLRVDGKASFGLLQDNSGAGQPRLSILFLSRAELEIRRGSLGVLLPGGWSLEMGRAVLQLSERVDGTLELHHLGGNSIQLTGQKIGVDGLRRTKRLTLASGGSVRLPALDGSHPVRLIR